MSNKEKKQVDVEKGKNNTYKLFYVLSVLLIIYMGFSAITSYQSFVEYCEAYKYTLASQWFVGFKTILAAVIPCLVYAFMLYGMGYVIKKVDHL